MADELAGANRRLHEMNRTLEELSTVDSLTGLANRRQFDRLLHLEWRRAIRGGNALSEADAGDFIAQDIYASKNGRTWYQMGQTWASNVRPYGWSDNPR